MTNLGQICPLSNLITIPVQWCIYCGMIKTSKRGVEVKKEENQISRWESLIIFYQSKLLSHFISVSLSPDTTLKERSLG